MRKFGLGLGLSVGAPEGAAAFDPATLSMTGWWRAAYAGSPWAGVTSAGSSGGRNLSEATNAPSVGANLNGLATADFDGANDRFFNVTWTTLFTAAAGTAIVLFNADTAAAEASTNGYDEPTLIGDGSAGVWGLSVHTSGGSTRRVRAHIDSTGYKVRVQTISLSTWHLATMRWDSANMTLDLDSLAASSIACGAVVGATGTSLQGLNYNGTAAFDGKIAEIMCFNTAISNDTLASIKGYINTRYGLAL